MSSLAYAPDKALFHQTRLHVLRDGGHVFPVHLHLIISDLCNLDCPGCFPPGVLVQTSEGYLPIEEVEEGMRVFGHDGKLHVVTKTMPHHHTGRATAFRVERLGGEFLQTDNHPFFVRRGFERMWLEARELRVGDEVAVRLPEVPPVQSLRLSRVLDGLAPVEDRPGHVRARGGKTTCFDRVPLGDLFGEIVGAYLGDGRVGRHPDRPASYYVEIDLGGHQQEIAERLANNFKAVFALDAQVVPGSGNTLLVKVGSSVVGRLLLALCETGSHDKQIHPALHGAPREFVEGLLRGYAWTDGCVDDKSFSTVSKPLALAVHSLALRAGLSPTLFEQPGRPSQIKGRAIRAIGPRYLLRFRGEDRQLFDRIVGAEHTPAAAGYERRNWKPMEPDDAGFYWLKVKSVEQLEYDGPVYNFEVEGVHSYTANGLVTHNCAYRMPGYSSNQHFGIVDPVSHAVNNNPSRFLETELVERVLRDCAAMGTKAVEFTGGGEPTVHPDAPRLLALAQELGLDTALITNGIRLSRMEDAAVKTQWLRVSIDAATPETFARVRPGLGGQNYFEKALQGIRWALARKDALGTNATIGFGFVVQKDNWQEIYQAVALAAELGVDNIRLSGLFTPEGDRYHAEYRKAAEDLERRATADFDGKRGRYGTFRVYGRFSEKVADLTAPPDYERCSYQRFTTYLGGDAKLYRCCVTSYNDQGYLGDVRAAGGLRALWESQELRQKLDSFDARSCPRCQFNDRNRAINTALAAKESPPAPPPANVVHPFFV